MPDELEGLTEEQKKEYRAWQERYTPLGNDLAVAFIAHRMMVSNRTIAKQHADLPTGNFWLGIAEIVERSFTNKHLQVHLFEFVRFLRDENDKSGDY